ncbi:MAG: hypothetical protein AWU55_2523, partial [Halomonadaceae bacterium T82-2]
MGGMSTMGGAFRRCAEDAAPAGSPAGLPGSAEGEPATFPGPKRKNP